MTVRQSARVRNSPDGLQRVRGSRVRAPYRGPDTRTLRTLTPGWKPRPYVHLTPRRCAQGPDRMDARRRRGVSNPIAAGVYGLVRAVAGDWQSAGGGFAHRSVTGRAVRP